MRKILFVSPTGTLDNGAERATVSLMLYLRQAGHTVVNVFPENQHPTSSDYQSSLEAAGVICYPLSSLNWWWEEAPGVLHRTHEERVLYYHQNIRDIRAVIKAESIDLTISNTVNVFQGAVAAAAEQTEHFWLIHENPTEEFAYYREKLDFILDSSDQVFAVSDRLAQVLNQLTGTAKVKPFIPYAEISETALSQGERRRLISVGKINANKNQLELIKAFQRLGRKDLDLILVGGWDEAYKAVCDAYIEAHGLENIYFLGHQSQPWSFAQSSDICVLTSKMESFGLVCIEAVLNGLPIIYPDNPGYLSVADYLGLDTAYPLGDVERLTERIQDLLAKGDEQRVLALEKAGQVREQYRPEKTYQRILEAIAQPAYRPKSLAALSGLFGEMDLSRLLERAADNQVTLFFAGSDGAFNEQNSQHYELERERNLTFEVPAGTRKLRIDLSERPSFFSEVTLTSQKYGTVLLPNFQNALTVGPAYLFDSEDPQLIYDINADLDAVFTLSYRQLIFSETEKELGCYLTGLLRNFQQDVDHLENTIAEKQAANQLLEQELHQLHQDYHRVIGSRRWRIPTNIINFFRREK